MIPNRGFTLSIKEPHTYWKFPQDKFIDYDASDEWWCKKYGFGHEVKGYKTITIPNCQIYEIRENGGVYFRSHSSVSERFE